MKRLLSCACVTLGLVLLVACDDELEEDEVAGEAGGALTGSVYWNDLNFVHKTELATGADVKLGAAGSFHRAADGKMVIVGAQGIEEGEESLLTTRLIKKSDTSADESGVNYDNVQVSPDGTKIAYDTLSESSFVCARSDGALLASFKKPGVTDAFLRPTWTPDGRIVVGGGFNNPGIFVSDAALTTLTRIDPGLRQPKDPAVSPDGTKVAFVLNELVYVINIDGTGLLQIDTDDTSSDKYPFWSPDSQFIAYLGVAGHIKIRPATGGDAVDVLETYPDLADKILIFGSSAPPQWVAD